jgi:hypothetical protein
MLRLGTLGFASLLVCHLGKSRFGIGICVAVHRRFVDWVCYRKRI